MLGAIIFDFDGVIADSEALHLHAFNETLAKFNAKISEEEYFKTFLGLTDIDCFKLVIERKPDNFKNTSLETLRQNKKDIFEKSAATESKILEGVPAFLEMLKKDKIPMAICSGALLSEIDLILKGAKLANYFETIVSAEQVKRGKPFPDGFLLALEKLNQKNKSEILPNQCIVIEDSHWGIEAAKAANMHTIAVTNSYDAEQLSMAEKIIANLKQISLTDLHNLCR